VRPTSYFVPSPSFLRLRVIRVIRLCRVIRVIGVIRVIRIIRLSICRIIE
jgi:hypothetical protein